MPWSIVLSNGTTSLTLNDGSAYNVSAGGFLAPTPERRRVSVGNLFRDGDLLMERRYMNRAVTVRLHILGATQDALVANQRALYQALERAKEYSVRGDGAAWTLTVQRPNETKSVIFDVLDGMLDIGADQHNLLERSSNPIILDATLTLECKPFARRAAETIENYLRNAGFELGATASADWTVSNGTPAIDTGDKQEGAQSCAITLAAAAAQFSVSQTRTMTAGNHVGVVRYKITGDQSYEAYISDAGGTTAAALTADGTWRTATVTRDSGANTAITLGIRTTGAVTDVNDVVKVDKWFLDDGTAAPTAWVSGREVVAHNDVAGQQHVNTLDIEDVPGDVPALLKLRIKENEAHTKAWGAASVGTYQRTSRWYEGEDTTANAIGGGAGYALAVADVADANSSAGNFARGRITSGALVNVDNEVQFRWDWIIAAASLPKGLHRVLIRATIANQGNVAKMRWGLGYVYGGITYTPASSEYKTCAVIDQAEILDLGTIYIPPVDTPSGETEASLVIRIFADTINTQTCDVAENVDWYLDAIMLLPVDQGQVFASKTSAQEHILVSSLDDLRALWLLDTSDVMQSFPAGQLGTAPLAWPSAWGGTRLHFMVDVTGSHVISDGASVEVSYTPRYLQVAGA